MSKSVAVFANHSKALLLSSALALIVADPAAAAVFNVGNAADLATAIATANSNGQPNSIVLTGNIDLTAALPVIGDDAADDLSIDLGGFTISGQNVTRVFFANAGSLRIANGSLSSGLAKGGNGGVSDGLDSGAGGGGMGAGGALYVRTGTTVELNIVSFAGNAATGGTGGATNPGGPDGGAGGGGGLGGDGGFGGGARNGTIPGGGGGGGGALPGQNGADGSQQGGNGGGPAGGAGSSGAGTSGGDLSGGGGGGQNGPGANGGYGGGGGGIYDLGFFGGDGGFGGGGGGAASTDAAGSGGFGGGSGGARNGITPAFQSGFGGGIGSTDRSGGGGAAFGGAVFVQNGATLVIRGSGTLGGGAVTAGAAGGAGSTAGLANGTGIYLQNSTIIFAPGAGESQTINDVIADDFGNTDGNGDGTYNDASGGGRVEKSGAGILTLSAVNGYADGTYLNAGTISVASDAALGSAASSLTFNGGVLQVTGIAFNSITRTINWGAAGGGFDIADAANTFSVAQGLSGPGGLTKEGAGTLVLTAGNTYDGATTVNAGALNIRNPNSLGSTLGGTTVAAGAALQIQDSISVGAEALSLNGSGVNNDGALRNISGLNTYDGAVSLAGAVRINSDAGQLILNGGISGADTQIVFGGAGDLFINSAIATGAGGITKDGTGTTLLSGNNTFTGAATVNAGTLQAFGGNALSDTATLTVNALARASFLTAETVGNIAGAGTLRIFDTLTAGDATSSSEFSGVIEQVIPSSFVKQGSGTLILSGSNIYTGTTTVNAGTLSVNGSIASSSLTTVTAGAILGGIGTVGATTISGTMAPGNSIGTLTVAGDLNFADGSTYAVEVSPIAADRTNVFGQATLSGGTVVVTYLPGTFITSDYTILNASAGFGGTQFAGLTAATLPGLTSALRYDANNVYLDFTLAPVVPPVVPPAGPVLPSDLPQNQENAVNAILGYFAANGGLPAEFLTLDAMTLPQVIGEIGTSAITAGLQSANGFLNLLGDPRNGARVQAASASEPLAFGEVGASGGTATQTVSKMAGYPMGDASAGYGSGWTVWGGVYGGSSETEGDAGVGSSDIDADSFGLAGGIEHVFGNGAIGLALGGGTSSFGLDDGLGDGDERSFNAGLYANQDFGNAYLFGALAYGYHDVDTSRVALGNQYDADFHANSWSGRIEGGYRFDTAFVAISPYAAAQAINYDLGGYAESGAGVFGLSYDNESTTATRVELGSRFEHAIAMDSDTVLRLTGRAAWAINGNTERRIQASFQSLPGTSFSVDGAEPDRNAALIDLGAEFDFGNGVSAGASFVGEFSDNVESYGGKAKLSMKW